MQSPLVGTEGERAQKAVILDGDLGDGDNLLTDEVLIEQGFAQVKVTKPPTLGGEVGPITHDNLHPTDFGVYTSTLAEIGPG